MYTNYKREVRIYFSMGQSNPVIILEKNAFPLYGKDYMNYLRGIFFPCQTV